MLDAEVPYCLASFNSVLSHHLAEVPGKGMAMSQVTCLLDWWPGTRQSNHARSSSDTYSTAATLKGSLWKSGWTINAPKSWAWTQVSARATPVNTQQVNKVFTRSDPRLSRQTQLRYYSLRQRMLHFCRDYIYYVTVEVLEPKSHEFLATLRQAETIDDVLHCHRLRPEASSTVLSARQGFLGNGSTVAMSGDVL